MSTTFIISDTHFSQQSMCSFLRPDGTKLRPWNTAEEMDEAMISNWNAVVKPSDKVYHCGDVVMARKALPILDRLNGHKRLLRGNHDVFKTKDYMKYFEEIYGVRVLADMILSHFPINEDNITKRYRVNVHGHIHGHEIPNGKYFNASVEQINFTPISLEDLRLAILKKQERYPVISYPNYSPID